MSGETRGAAVMRGDATGRRGTRLDFVQGAGQQSVRQQGIDGRNAERHGLLAGALGAVGALQAAHLFAKSRRDRACCIVGSRGSKSIWGNDGHRPLKRTGEMRWMDRSCFVLFLS
jgi:hypothetical protein